MKRTSVFLCFLVAFGLSMVAWPAKAAPIRVNGYIHWEKASGLYAPASPGNKVKFCRNNGTAQAASGQGPTCVNGTVGVNGSVNYFEVYVPEPGYYWMFTWNTNNDWGSSTSIARGAHLGFNFTQIYVPTYYLYDVQLYSPPSPRKPVAVYPAHTSLWTPTSFTLKWTSGLDADRTSPNWPVTYDVYANGPGAPENLVLSNVPCNADSSGNCTYPITNLLSAQLYYWRVEAKLNPQLGSTGDPYYRNKPEKPSYFATDGTTYSLTSENGRFVGATNCGGSTVTATSTSQGLCQTLKLVDLNGGSLYSGDPVYIEIYGQPFNFVAAYGGGGSLLATSQWGGSWETFTVAKASGWGALGDGDQITLQAFNGQYCAAEGGGGGAVNCNRNEVGPWEVFTLGVN